MLTWLLLILVTFTAVIGLGMLFARAFGRGESLPVEESDDVTAANIDAIRDGNLDAISIDLVARGYHQGQTDAVIEALMARNAELESLLNPERALAAEPEVSEGPEASVPSPQPEAQEG